LAVDQNFTNLTCFWIRSEIIKSIQQTHDCALSRSSCAHDANTLTTLNFKRNTFENLPLICRGLVTIVSKIDIFKFDFPFCNIGRLRMLGLRNGTVLLEYFHDHFDVNPGHAELFPKPAELTQWLHKFLHVNLQNCEVSESECFLCNFAIS